MANNRMYLLHEPTGRAFYLAKYYPSTGWYQREPETLGTDLMRFFVECDFWHLTDEQRQENYASPLLRTPHKSFGGSKGADYVVAYESDDRIKEYWQPQATTP